MDNGRRYRFKPAYNPILLGNIFDGKQTIFVLLREGERASKRTLSTAPDWNAVQQHSTSSTTGSTSTVQHCIVIGLFPLLLVPLSFGKPGALLTRLRRPRASLGAAVYLRVRRSTSLQPPVGGRSSGRRVAPGSVPPFHPLLCCFC